MLNSSLKSRVLRLEAQRRAVDDYTPLSALVRDARALLEREAALPPAERLALASLDSLVEADEPGGPFGSAAHWRRLMQEIRRASAKRAQPQATA